MYQRRFDKQSLEYLINYFKSVSPNPRSELVFENNYQLLVSVVLSAQCTDSRVNLVTPDLFSNFPDFESLAAASFDEVFNCIKSCTYPNCKTNHLISFSKIIVEDYNGMMPETREQLMTLPGVGRKTANVVMAVAFNKPFFAVDTHVFRVANRIGLANASTPLETENQLTELFPAELIPDAHHWLLLHGRYVCKSQRPLCDKCALTSICTFHNNN